MWAPSTTNICIVTKEGLMISRNMALFLDGLRYAFQMAQFQKDEIYRLLPIIEETTLSAKIEYIETIEKYLTEQHPHKQTEIEFPKTQHEKIMKIAKDVNNLNIPKSKK